MRIMVDSRSGTYEAQNEIRRREPAVKAALAMSAPQAGFMWQRLSTVIEKAWADYKKGDLKRWTPLRSVLEAAEGVDIPVSVCRQIHFAGHKAASADSDWKDHSSIRSLAGYQKAKTKLGHLDTDVIGYASTRLKDTVTAAVDDIEDTAAVIKQALKSFGPKDPIFPSKVDKWVSDLETAVVTLSSQLTAMSVMSRGDLCAKGNFAQNCCTAHSLAAEALRAAQHLASFAVTPFVSVDNKSANAYDIQDFYGTTYEGLGWPGASLYMGTIPKRLDAFHSMISEIDSPDDLASFKIVRTSIAKSLEEIAPDVQTAKAVRLWCEVHTTPLA